MGRLAWEESDYATYSAATSAKTRAEIFKSKSIDDSLDPSKFEVRESCDSDVHPNSTPIIIGVDNTGSMGRLSESITKRWLGVIFNNILEEKPISDPHLMVAAVGDSYVDKHPLQATQFEAGVNITEQIEKIFIEGGGGANNSETYSLVHYLAAYKTRCDSQIKRSKKGYLFTIGDECNNPAISRDQIKTIFGDDVQSDVTARELLDAAMQNWNVFHIIIKPVRNQPVVEQWRDFMGQNAIQVSNEESLPEVIVSTIRLMEGDTLESVADSFSDSTAVVVRDALKDIAVSESNPNSDVVAL